MLHSFFSARGVSSLTSPSTASGAVALACLFFLSPAAAQAGTYQRTIIVSPTPGNPAASGQTLLDAVEATAPTASDPWLIKIEPGIYDLESRALEMKPWLDIEGSGTGTTMIQGLGQIPQTFNRGIGVVIGADDAEIRNLTVNCVTEQAKDRRFCIAMANPFVSPRVTNLRLVSEGYGSHWGFRNTGAAPRLEGVEIEIAGGDENYGIVNANGSRPTIRRVQVNVRDGELNNFGLFDRGGSLAAVIDDSEITVEGGEFAAGVFAADQLAADEIRMVDVKMTVEGAGENYGILNGDQHLLLRSTRIKAGAPGAAIDLAAAGEARIFNSELDSQSLAVRASQVQVGSTLVVGGGAIVGVVDQSCGGVAVLATSGSAFYPESCPGGGGFGNQRLSRRPSLRAGYGSELDALDR